MNYKERQKNLGKIEKIEEALNKGVDRNYESYSVFEMKNGHTIISYSSVDSSSHYYFDTEDENKIIEDYKSGEMFKRCSHSHHYDLD